MQKPSNKKTSIDGFSIKRRMASVADTNRQFGGISTPKPQPTAIRNRRYMEEESKSNKIDELLSRTDIDASLASIDRDPSNKKPSKRRNWKRIVKRFVIAVMIVGILIGVGLGVQAIIAASKVVDGNLLDLLSKGEPLKKDENGRSNILIFGTSEDSAAHIENGAGADLTDSMMIASIDQDTKDVLMFSIPRDLWVTYGEACVTGYEGRINVVYQCGADGGTPEDGARKLMSVAGDVFGLDIQYYVKVNYTAVKDAVNAVGGITVEIESDDLRGIYDPNFDWQCNYDCNLVKWPNGPADLNGDQALALARARNAAGGYGLSRGNFDREQNQQKILVALRNKAASAGTLANPASMSQLISSLGDNVRSNFKTGEIKTLITLARDVDPVSIERLSFVEEDDALLTTGSIDGQSIVRPYDADLDDFSALQDRIAQLVSKDPVVKEAAVVDVYNSTTVDGLATRTADMLESAKFVIGVVDGVDAGDYGEAVIYDLSPGSKPGTLEALKKTMPWATVSTQLPSDVQSTADFVIIVGSDRVY